MPPRPAMSLRLPSLSVNKLLPPSFWLFCFLCRSERGSCSGVLRPALTNTKRFSFTRAIFFLSLFWLCFSLPAGLTAWGKKSEEISSPFPCFFDSFSAFSVLAADYLLLSFFAAIRLVLTITAALAAAELLRDGTVKFERVALALAAFSVVQSLVGFGQFAFQGGLGLKFLGEPEIGPLVGGASKVLAGGGSFCGLTGRFRIRTFLPLFFFRDCFPFIISG